MEGQITHWFLTHDVHISHWPVQTVGLQRKISFSFVCVFLFWGTVALKTGEALGSTEELGSDNMWREQRCQKVHGAVTNMWREQRSQKVHGEVTNIGHLSVKAVCRRLQWAGYLQGLTEERLPMEVRETEEGGRWRRGRTKRWCWDLKWAGKNNHRQRIWKRIAINGD